MALKTKECPEVNEGKKPGEKVDLKLLKKLLLEDEEVLVEEITVDCICGVY